MGSIREEVSYADFDLTACMFGSLARGATRLRTYGSMTFAPLSKVCRKTGSGFTCGSRLHAQGGVADAERAPPYPAAS